MFLFFLILNDISTSVKFFTPEFLPCHEAKLSTYLSLSRINYPPHKPIQTITTYFKFNYLPDKPVIPSSETQNIIIPRTSRISIETPAAILTTEELCEVLRMALN